MTLREAIARLDRTFALSCRDGLCGPLEADERLNDASRAVVRACYEEHGAAWLGKINAYSGDCQSLWQWQGEELCNFGADFVLPLPAEDVIRLVGAYRNAGLGRAAEWAELIDRINEAVKRAGGTLLVWS